MTSLALKHKDNKATGITDNAKKTPTSHMRKKLPKLAKLCDRYSISQRAGAPIATAVLENFGLLTTSDKTNITDKNKFHGEREKEHKMSCCRMKILLYDSILMVANIRL